ncbi:MAG: CRISPR-associated endonuclease Cas3'' [Desulfurococcaceae archaeon]
MELDTLRKALHSMWPVAYAEVSCSSNLHAVTLEEHLVSTAQLIVELFSERLNYLERRYKSAEHCIGSLREMAYLTGLLHDLGKASVYYMNKFIAKTVGGPRRSEHQEKCRENKLQFVYHEYVAPLIIIHTLHNELSSHARDRSGIYAMINTYYTISRVIARHHAAMTERHPMELMNLMTGFGRTGNVLTEVLKGLCEKESNVDDLLRVLKKNCMSRFCSEFLEKILSNLSAACTNPSSAMVHLKVLKAFNLESCDVINEYDSYRITSTLAGFLIVADNLVSSYCEKRVSDDETTPAYVEIWKRELRAKLGKLENRILAERCQW